MRQQTIDTMKNKTKYYILTILTFLFVSCGTDKKETVFHLKETINEDGDSYAEGIADLEPSIKKINKNFKRINSVVNWTSIDTLQLEEKAEFGDAKYYYQNGQLEKIITRNFGDTSQLLTEYYLLDRQLSFVYEKTYPIDDYWLKRSYFVNGNLIYNNQSRDCGAPCSPEYMTEEQKRIIPKFEKLIAKTKKK